MKATSFSDVTYDDAIRRARELVPALRDRAERAEQARIMLPETMSDLNRTGVLRVLQPRRWGGMELDFVSCFDVAYELGRGCASTAWTGVNLLIHHWMLALYDDRAQEEVWGQNPDAGIASGVIPAQGEARPVDGGYIVSGRWNFSSGVHVSDWNMLAVTVRDGGKVIDQRLCVLHKSEYETVDDWQVLGMRSTGSMTVVARDVFVPTHRTLAMIDMRGGDDFPGARSNPGPLYRVALSMLSGHVISGAVVGNAQAALELTVESIKQRSAVTTGFRMRDLQAVQMRVGASAARIDAARQLIRSEMVEAQEFANRNEVPDQERKLRAKRNVSYGVALCTEAVDNLLALGGANGIYDRNPIQRIFRDAHAGGSHVLFGSDLNFSTWGLLALGGEVANNLL